MDLMTEITLVVKDTVSGDVARLDVILDILEQLPGDGTKGSCHSDILIALSIRQIISCVG